LTGRERDLSLGARLGEEESPRGLASFDKRPSLADKEAAREPPYAGAKPAEQRDPAHSGPDAATADGRSSSRRLHL